MGNQLVKSALKKFSKRSFKEGSIGSDCSIHTPLTELIFGPPLLLPSARTTEAISRKMALSSSMEEDLRKERMLDLSVSSSEVVAAMVSTALIDAGEKTKLEFLG